MSSQTASPVDVLDDTTVAKVLRSAKRRVIAALDLGFLDEWMDNGPGRNPKYDRSRMLRGLLLCPAEVRHPGHDPDGDYDDIDKGDIVVVPKEDKGNKMIALVKHIVGGLAVAEKA